MAQQTPDFHAEEGQKQAHLLENPAASRTQELGWLIQVRASSRSSEVMWMLFEIKGAMQLGPPPLCRLARAGVFHLCQT